MLNVVKHLALLPECYKLDERPLAFAEILRFNHTVPVSFREDDVVAIVMLNAVKHPALLPEHPILAAWTQGDYNQLEY
jgi:hypothetical protein